MSMLDKLLGLMRVLYNGVEVSASRRTLNFKGNGVVVTDNGAEDCYDVTIGGGGGGGGAPTGAAGGDLAGTYPNPTLAAAKTSAILASAAAAAVLTATCYQGNYSGNIAPTASVWTNFLSMLPGTLTDVISKGITRSGSTFTVSKTGYYRISATFLAYGTNVYLGLRLRSAAPATLLQQVTYSAASSSVGNRCLLEGVFQATAGDVFTLQYCASAAGNATAISLDGETTSFGSVSMQYLGV